jgi:arsenate reductase
MNTPLFQPTPLIRSEEHAVDVLAALAQTARLQAFKHLVQVGPNGLVASEIAQRLNMPASAVSFHLKELLGCELVFQEREGRNLRYTANLALVQGLVSYLLDQCCEGNACIQVLGAPPLPVKSVQQGLLKLSTHLQNSQGARMSQRVMNVLFLCTGNSARSIMAESILNQVGAGRFKAYSAGSMPRGAVHPRTLELLQQHNLSTQELRSKDWAEFSTDQAPVMDFVLTVCDKAAGEVCPVWPGQPISAHWGVEDPVECEGSAEQQHKAFSDAFMVLHRRISFLINLPIDKLDRLALHREITQIGQQ